MKSRGFTLIEIIVSLAIFSVVAVIAIGALVRVTSANRQAQAIQSGVNNVSFIMDSMSRELRVGTNILCYRGSTLDSNNTSLTFFGNTCTPGAVMDNKRDTLISFNSANTSIGTGDTSCNLLYAYLFHVPGTSGATTTTTIYKAQATSCTDTLQNLIFYPLTSQTVNITDYKVGVFGGVKPQLYEWVYLRLKGYVGVQIKDRSIFDVETSISERNNQS